MSFQYLNAGFESVRVLSCGTLADTSIHLYTNLSLIQLISIAESSFVAKKNSLTSLCHNFWKVHDFCKNYLRIEVANPIRKKYFAFECKVSVEGDVVKDRALALCFKVCQNLVDLVI